jgi:FkbM family methyltransferase
LYCVEPNVVAAELLRRNLKANRLDDNVTVLNAAVSYGPHDVGFVSGKSHLGGHIVHQDVGTIVEAVNLSYLLDRFGLPQCSLVCDIEGSELAMIAGDRPGLSRCRQLIIELHPTAIEDTMYSTEELASELSVSHGFRLAYRDGNVFVFERECSPSAERR